MTPMLTRITRGLVCALLAAAALSLTGCGFHLRNQANLPFSSLYIQASAGSTFAPKLKRDIGNASGTKLVTNAKDAEATVQVISELQERQILSLSSSGRVQELTLLYHVTIRVYDAKREFLTPTEIVLRRDLTYQDTDVIAKEQEEALLYRDMQSDAVQQVMRRLQALQITPAPPAPAS